MHYRAADLDMELRRYRLIEHLFMKLANTKYFFMKTKPLDLKKKLVLNKEKLAQLTSDSQANVWGGAGSLIVSCVTGDVCIRPTYEYKTCLCPTWAPGSCYPDTRCIG